MKIYALLISLLFLGNAMAQKVDYDKKLSSLGIELFAPPKPKFNYVKSVRVGNLVYLAGHGSTKADGSNLTGKVGKDVTVEQGVEAARIATISLLASLKAEIGSLNKVKRIVKVTGWVNCTDDFTDQSKVMNGCSDLLVAIFGEMGLHVRSSIGTNSLPNNFTTEIEMVVEMNNLF
ncbi:MAG: RidA family protein [Bacteroidota bacterium]